MIDFKRIMKVIAKEKGYKFVDLNDNPHGAIVKGPNIAILNDEGKTVDYGWSFDDAIEKLPQWMKDDHAALDLMKGTERWTLERNVSDWCCVINPGTPIEVRSSKTMTTMAFAICDAWLTNHEINEDWQTP